MRGLDYILERSIPEPNSGCWLWLGCVDRDGYGKVLGRPHTPHKVSFIALNGEVPKGLEIHHKCNIPSCCNPDHLEAVTHHENVLASDKIGTNNQHSRKTHCIRGHELSPDNIYLSKNKTKRGNTRKCKKCVSIKNKIQYLKRKGI